MSWVRSCGYGTSYITFDTVTAELTKVAGFQELHTFSKKRLALSLIESRRTYEWHHKGDMTVSPKVSAAKIKNLLGSLNLLSSFEKDANLFRRSSLSRDAKFDPASRDAMNRILFAADEAADPGARQSVSNFFSEVEQVYRVAKEAERQMRRHVQEREPVSAIVWLCGRELPKVYSKFFGAAFTTTRGNNAGIAFIQGALRAMKVRDSISDETIISHYKAAHKAG